MAPVEGCAVGAGLGSGDNLDDAAHGDTTHKLVLARMMNLLRDVDPDSGQEESEKHQADSN